MKRGEQFARSYCVNGIIDLADLVVDSHISMACTRGRYTQRQLPTGKFCGSGASCLPFLSLMHELAVLMDSLVSRNIDMRMSVDNTTNLKRLKYTA